MPSPHETRPEMDNGEPVVCFEHPFFTLDPNCLFRLREDDDTPVMALCLGDSEVTLAFPGICREFGLAEDSHDGRMLDKVGKGLRYVSVLRVGDPLPAEMVTGAASWEASDRHRKLARDRLTMQLVSWLTGDEFVLTDADQLTQIVDDPSTRDKVNQAFAEAADALGWPREERERVVDLVESLAAELAYVEALRQAHGQIQAMRDRFLLLRRRCGKDTKILDSLTAIIRMTLPACREFDQAFDNLDAQTGEIMAVLKNVDAHIGHIREGRDDLHRQIAPWQPFVQHWAEASMRPSRELETLVGDTYRFLARRYPQEKTWNLVTRSAQSVKAGTERTW